MFAIKYNFAIYVTDHTETLMIDSAEEMALITLLAS